MLQNKTLPWLCQVENCCPFFFTPCSHFFLQSVAYVYLGATFNWYSNKAISTRDKYVHIQLQYVQF